MIERLEATLNRYNELTSMLSSPEILGNVDKMTSLSKEQASIGEVVEKYKEYKKVDSDLEEAKELSRIVTEVSHNHPESFKAAEAISLAIYYARNGKNKEFIKKIITDNYYNIDFTLDDIRDSYKFNVSCQGCVPQAFEAFFESKSYVDAIRNAISIGGDSDTIAAITGSIAGAYYGIPIRLIKKAYTFFNEKYDSDLLEPLYEFEKKYPTKAKIF